MAAPRILRALATIALTLGIAVAAPAAAAASSVAADVDDFSYASWDARYDVGLDDEGRAVMHVTETLVARFPDFDQNRGVVRGLATSYENAGIDTRVLSVTDENGAPVPFETETDDGVLYVLIGDDDFVQGLTTYVIDYEMRDVILAAETDIDEFYWDLLPLDSTQRIEQFRAEIVFDPAMSSGLTGAVRCYEGLSGSEATCAIEGPVDADGSAHFTVESGERPAGDGMTVAIGFASGTVAQPAARQPNPVTDVVPFFAGLGAVGLSIGSWFAAVAFTRRRRTATGIVVAQYDVPDSMPPLLAGAVIPSAKATLPAEIVHLAVYGVIRIEEGAETEQPRLRRLPGGRTPDELDVAAVDALFLTAEDDDVVDVPTASEDFAMRMVALEQLGKITAESRGLTVRARSRGAMIAQWVAIAAAAIGFALSLWGVVSGRNGAVPALVVMSFIVFLVLLSCAYSFSKHTVLTPEGALAYEYLLGVKEFIRVAEADRLRMLQSYRGAERRQDGSANVIVLYEHLLPYAMLFGMEDEWGRVLEYVYSREQRGPGWIGDPGSSSLRTSLAAFALSTHSASTYTSPSTDSSSSFGGSSGGGFSGGGGGGGFSGGR